MQLIRQTEAAECGLACLCMVAHHHGQQVDLASLRRRHPISMKGATLAQHPQSLRAFGAETPLQPGMAQLLQYGVVTRVQASAAPNSHA